MTERPRDLLGRPLPAGADPSLAVPGFVPGAAMGDEQTWAVACDYLDRGMPFHAHEVFEARWRACPAADRDAWRALAQWGAALTHHARGNDVGARRLAQRAMGGLATATRLPAVIDVARVRDSCRQLD